MQTAPEDKTAQQNAAAPLLASQERHRSCCKQNECSRPAGAVPLTPQQHNAIVNTLLCEENPTHGRAIFITHCNLITQASRELKPQLNQTPGLCPIKENTPRHATDLTTCSHHARIGLCA